MTDFKIGQRVRYIYQYNAPQVDWIQEGQIGTINDINLEGDDAFPVYVDFDDGLSTCFQYDELELVHPIARTHSAFDR